MARKTYSEEFRRDTVELYRSSPGATVVGEAVDLATRRPAGLQEHGDVLRDLEDGQRLDLSPAAFARLIGHLLRNTTAPFWGARHLTKIVPRLRDKVDASELRPLVEEALRLGCNDAPTW